MKSGQIVNVFWEIRPWGDDDYFLLLCREEKGGSELVNFQRIGSFLMGTRSVFMPKVGGRYEFEIATEDPNHILARSNIVSVTRPSPWGRFIKMAVFGAIGIVGLLLLVGLGSWVYSTYSEGRGVQIGRETVVLTVLVPQTVVPVTGIATVAATPSPTIDPIQTQIVQERATGTAIAASILNAEATRAAAVSAKETAVAAAFRATRPPLLGQAVEANGLSLIARAGPGRGYGGWTTVVGFAVDNRTGQRLNFDILPAKFYMELSNGSRYPGSTNPIAINGFDNNTRREFAIEFSLAWDRFEAFQRDPTITHYFVAATTFGEGRIENARWCDELRGTPCR